MARNFRSVWRWLIPSWLAHPDDPTDEGALVAHAVTTIIDATLERARQGLDARFPSRTGESANELTAADRGLLRGRSETLAAFAARLAAWRYPRTHKVRGNASELLVQVAAYWGPTTAETVDLRGTEWAIDTAGTVAKTGTVAWDWDSVDVYVTPTVGTASNVLDQAALTPSVPACEPGALLLAHVFAEGGGTVPAPSGWTLVAAHVPVSGTRYHAVFGKVATDRGGGTLSIDASSIAGRALARVVQVPGEFSSVATAIETYAFSAGTGTSVAEPAVSAAPWAANVLAFVGYDSGGTINAFSGGDMTWTELAAEAVAGSAGGGAGIQEQYAPAVAADGPGGTCTLGNSAVWGAITIRLRRPWARFWVQFRPLRSTGVGATPDLGDPALWGGAVGTPGYVVGLVGVTPADVLAMRNLFQQYAWHPEHARPEWLVVSIPPSVGADVPGPQATPDGTWLHWSRNVGGTQTPARSSSHRFVSFTPLQNNVYAGDPESFCDDSYLPDGTTYAGDPENAAAWGAVTLPDGTTYTGDPENAAAWDAVLLLDDGANA